MYDLNGKHVLVTGVCGTVGSALVAELLQPKYGIAEVLGVDNNESELFSIDQKYLADPRAHFTIGDLRDADAMHRLAEGMDVILAAAALKHVIVCERSPMDAVQTNILGVQNLIRAARDARVDRVVVMSTDKAVNPTSVMGTSKLMGERLVTAANANSHATGTAFISTRFGNVLGSRGSVVPIFANQIARGGPVTLTDPRMTRFIMSTQQAVHLVIESALLGKGGEVFITKMPAARIQQLAEVMIRQLAPELGVDPEKIEVTEIGSKPGEKLYEELMSGEETRRALELQRYFVVLPAYRGIYNSITYEYPEVVSHTVTNSYVSKDETPMTDEELTDLLRVGGLLDASLYQDATRRYWPGDKESAITAATSVKA